MDSVLAPLQHFYLLSNLLHELYHLEFTILQTKEDISAFCSRHCFHPLQKEFTPTGLDEIILQAVPDTIVHITDYFHIHLMLFTLEQTCVAMGPFCPLLFSQKDAHYLLSDSRLQAINTMDFLSYASSYPFLSEKHARNITRSILHCIYPAEDDRTITDLTANSIQLTESEESESIRANYALLLEKRYSYEQNFRKNIMEGNQRAALLNLANMEQDVSYLKRIGSTLENEKTGAAIARTTARLAAMDGGLSGITADQISNQNTKDTLAARTVDDILRAKEKMICSYCTAVRTAKESQYSVLVQSVLYEMENKFHQDITLSDLANELAISKNYLIKRFKTEVGTTPIQYLTNFRLERAAMLLAEHTLSIQDVADVVGIPDSNYFTKLFKKSFHMTPQQYRKSKII